MPTFFFTQPAQLCAVTNITEILFKVMLSNYFNQPSDGGSFFLTIYESSFFSSFRITS